ncbi:pyridoxamine 5'-phosphate oxidase family protein [Nocardioides abyssi]|uniref:Pyridoxamine 5'-phosphate oxidase family protein n=1 Tax=Nocardioides abyssi TaxID=3058370 RepID=A0ABT8EVR6_9ACTN|nr:pyridoxamine 5'-phosphate oxidase family protein [Nocardioides abyssi]MDN4162056.1 pyridoxamine 5'-phosphate oxidase family protein [Nocardioides abyssi]
MTRSDQGTATAERLATEECWALLESETFGRLAYRLVDEVHLVPLDYAADGHAIHLRTGSGNKLLAAALESDVALETDWRGDGTAWSVVVRGRLRRLEPGEQAAVAPPARPWLDEVPHEVVELVPTSVEGRRFTWPPEVAATR